MLKDDASNVAKLSLADRSERSIEALTNRANAKRIAAQKKEAASRAMGWLNWDEALGLIAEAGELDPESLEIAEDDAVITRLSMQAMDPGSEQHRVGFGRYNRHLLELDLRGCTVDVNQLNRLLAWRTMHSHRYDHREAPTVNVLFEDRWLLGPLVQPETVAAQRQGFALQNDLATRIQQVARGWAERKRGKRTNELGRRHAAVSRLQRWMRAVWELRRLRVAAAALARTVAAMRVQRCWRGRAGRRLYVVQRAAWLAGLRRDATACAVGVLVEWNHSVLNLAWQRIEHRELWGITAEEEPPTGSDEPAPEGGSEVARLIAAASELSDDGDWEPALDLYGRAAEMILTEAEQGSGPADSELAFALHRGSAECHLGSEDWGNAAASFGAALAERPGDAHALHGRGCARWGEGRNALAWADFHRASGAGYSLAEGLCVSLEDTVGEEERKLALEMSHADDTSAAARAQGQREAVYERRQQEAAATTMHKGVRSHQVRRKTAAEGAAHREREKLGKELEGLLAAQTEEEKEAEIDVRGLLGVPLPRKLWQEASIRADALPAPPPAPLGVSHRGSPLQPPRDSTPRESSGLPLAIDVGPQSSAERALAMLEEEGDGADGDGAGGDESPGGDVQPWVGVWRP